LDGGVPVGLAAATGDACYPMIAYLGVRADADAERLAVRTDLERHGFKPVRPRTLFRA
jgi:hypothetical protein